MTISAASASDAVPIKVDVESMPAQGSYPSFTVSIDRADGSVETATVDAKTQIGGNGISIASRNGGEIFPVAYGSMTESTSALPGIMFGISTTTPLEGNAYNTAMACDPTGTDGTTCLVVGLKNKPQAQAATVAAVPTTGAPSSDLVLPAALLAAGMVGGGLLIRKRKDRGRA